MKKYFVRFFDDSMYTKLPDVLKTVFLGLCVAVVVSQTGLYFAKTRMAFTAADSLDGAISASGESVIQKGKVTLRLTEGEPDDKIVILVNGDEYAKFNSSTVEIDITNQSVIEIVNDTKQPVKVVADSISDNLYTAFDNGETIIDNLGVVCRVLFSN